MDNNKQWECIQLRDIISIKHGWAFKSEFMSEELTGKPILINIGNFSYSGGFRFESTRTREYRGNYPKEYELNPSDILLAMTCQTSGGEILGIPARTPDDGRVYLHNQRLGKVIVTKPIKVAPDYLYWLFLWKEFNYKLSATATGTKILHTAPNRIEEFEFNLPPLSEQQAIAKILFSLENKIIINSYINTTIARMAECLFEHWFVDFEFPNEEGKPYKASGGEMAYSDKLAENVPRDWMVRELGELIKFVKGKKPPLVSTTQDEGFQPQILIDALDGNSHFFAPIDGMVIVNVTDSLMVMDGASSGRIERGQQGVLGSTIAKVETHEAVNAFVYHFLKTKQEDIKQNTTGTSIPHADKSKIEKYLVATPTDDSIMRQFETLSKILLLKSINNCNQIRTLQKIRDMLLPKLMSGKIRVPLDNKMER